MAEFAVDSGKIRFVLDAVTLRWSHGGKLPNRSRVPSNAADPEHLAARFSCFRVNCNQRPRSSDLSK